MISIGIRYSKPPVCVCKSTYGLCKYYVAMKNYNIVSEIHYKSSEMFATDTTFFVVKHTTVQYSLLLNHYFIIIGSEFHYYRY